MRSSSVRLARRRLDGGGAVELVSVEGPEGCACDSGVSGTGGVLEEAGLEERRMSGRGLGWRGGRVGEPSELVSVPMFGGEEPGMFIPVGNGLATGLACDTTGFKVLGGRWDIAMWAIRVL